MKIKKLYLARCLPAQYVVETLDGKFFGFYHTPFRKVEEKDLIPLPGYMAVGNNSEEAAKYIYKLYGLEKI